MLSHTLSPSLNLRLRSFPNLKTYGPRSEFHSGLTGNISASKSEVEREAIDLDSDSRERERLSRFSELVALID